MAPRGTAVADSRQQSGDFPKESDSPAHDPGTLPAKAGRVWQVKYRPSRRRRRFVLRIALSLLVCSIIAICLGSWLTINVNAVSNDLYAAKSIVPTFQRQLMAKNDAGARESLGRLQRHTRDAKRAVSNPVWKVASALPLAGPNFATVSEIALAADDLVNQTAMPLLLVSNSLNLESLSFAEGKLDLAPVVESSAAIVSAANAVELTYDRLKALEQARLLPEVRESLGSVTAALDEARGPLSAAAETTKVLPTMLGNNGPRNYLVLLQNSAEVRATGGLPGALAVVNVDKGAIRLATQVSGASLRKFDPPVEVDAAQTQIYTSRLGRYISDVNLTPDFPTAAKTAKTMWEKRHGSRVDGVIALDTVALSHLLEATGPVTVGTSTQPIAGSQLPKTLTSRNVVQALLSDAYTAFESNELQDEYFSAVSQEMFDALTERGTPLKKLVHAMAKSTKEDRLLLWSDHKDEQSILSRTTLGGSIAGPHAGGASFGVYFNDGTGAKMDYYVRRTVQVAKECSSDSYSKIKITVTLRNTAPLDAESALPKFVTGGGRYGVPPGTVQTNVVAYGPSQSRIETVHQSGRKMAFGSQLHGRHPVGTVTTRLRPGEATKVEVVFDRIVQQDDPKVRITPTVQPISEVLLASTHSGCTTD